MIEHIELTEAYEATPGALADVAAEAVRALNHATFPGKERLTWPSDASEVFGSLHRLAATLPQTLDQLHRYLRVQYRAGRLATDTGADPGAVVDVIFDRVDSATRHLAGLVAELAGAHNAAAVLTVPGTIADVLDRAEQLGAAE